ncbi:YlbL family protein [Nocardioides dongxiaopingii]|uniref:YlbL family protein n=1 Tax=Nocardioides dongxiaopingii TaxID=2576036 RepID=UPI0010C77060|nr:PDZ domain-containing protein [Nocardioides dongxiaopingii]
MSQRLIAACIAVPAVLGLLLFASVVRLPYATYQPGSTVDVLGEDDSDVDIVQVDGHEVFRDDGELRMTTVRVSPAQDPDERGIGLTALMSTWFDGDNAVYPYDAVHQSDETAESNRQQGQLQMATSQDVAVDVALEEMGIEVPQVLTITQLTPGLPAEDVLEVGDVVRTIGGTDVTDAAQLVSLVDDSTPGEPLTVGVTRDGKPLELDVTPVDVDGSTKIGILPEVSDYEFPFEVKINISPQIGGPSAGLIFSLAIFDTLTEGSLTGGRTVAGTGEIFPDGSVGAIGGIQQKIAGARDEGAELFLVPIENCDDALGADPGDMRLMMARSMHDVREGLEAFAADPDATLPSCDDADEILSGAAS